MWPQESESGYRKKVFGKKKSKGPTALEGRQYIHLIKKAHGRGGNCTLGGVQIGFLAEGMKSIIAIRAEKEEL